MISHEFTPLIDVQRQLKAVRVQSTRRSDQDVVKHQLVAQRLVCPVRNSLEIGNLEFRRCCKNP